MSGPKVITYNMNAFQGKLGDFMRLQTHLSQLCKEIEQAVIHDEALKINYDCGEQYKKITKLVDKALITMVFDYKGNINKKTYDNIESQINERTKQLTDVIKASEKIVEDFNSKQNDYHSYKDYLTFIDNAKTSYQKFKDELAENTKQNFAKDNKNFEEEAQKKYGTIVFEEKAKKFDWGFSAQLDNEKNNIVNQLLEKENEMKVVRQQMLDNIIATDTKHKPTPTKKTKQAEPNTEIVRISQKIELLINSCPDKSISNNYNVLFNKLKQSESMNDMFFYSELHDRILESENSRKNKLTINDAIAELNEKALDKSLNKEKTALIQKAISIINNNKVTEKETGSIANETALLVAKNQQLLADIEIKKKEQQFIKTQIIHNFENLGYEVMDDLQVIDFEKENDFYLQAPGQENLLNIKFKEDGSFRYVFEIPQKKEALSTDEQKMKLHEMKTTCDDFANVLKDLKDMGVDINIESEKPIELNSMITIPEALNTKLNNQKKQIHRTQQIKKLYLD